MRKNAYIPKGNLLEINVLYISENQCSFKKSLSVHMKSLNEMDELSCSS